MNIPNINAWFLDIYIRHIEPFLTWRVLGVCIFLCHPVHAEPTDSPTALSGPLGVVYPETREPYRQIFLSILQGIEEAYHGQVISRELASDYKLAELEVWLKRNEYQQVIALGQRGMHSMADVKAPPRTVIGAALISPSESKYSGISLVPSPLRIVPLVRKLVPQVKRIYVIGDISEQWIFDRSKEIFTDETLELVLIQANTIQEVALKYREVLLNMKSTSDALWISANGISLANPILNNVLEAAWNNNLVVFSSNLSDVKRGALFSFYANNRDMGNELVDFTIKMGRLNESEVRVVPTESVSVALNIRTADHLNLHYDKDSVKIFSLIYPPPSNRYGSTR